MHKPPMGGGHGKSTTPSASPAAGSSPSTTSFGQSHYNPIGVYGTSVPSPSQYSPLSRPRFDAADPDRARSNSSASEKSYHSPSYPHDDRAGSTMNTDHRVSSSSTGLDHRSNTSAATAATAAARTAELLQSTSGGSKELHAKWGREMATIRALSARLQSFVDRAAESFTTYNAMVKSLNEEIACAENKVRNINSDLKALGELPPDDLLNDVVPLPVFSLNADSGVGTKGQESEAAAQEELQVLQEKLQEKESLVADLQRKMERQQDDHQTQVDRLIADHQAASRTKLSEADGLRAELDGVRRLLQAKSSEVEGLQSVLHRKELEFERLQAKLDSVSADLQQQLQAKSKEIESLHNVLQRNQRELQTTKEQLNEERSSHTATQSLLRQERGEHHLTTSQLSDERRGHAATQSQLRQEQVAHATTTSKLQQEESAHTSTRAQLQDERRSHEGTKREFGVAMVELDGFRRERDALEAEKRRIASLRKVGLFYNVRENEQYRPNMEALAGEAKARVVSLEECLAIIFVCFISTGRFDTMPMDQLRACVAKGKPVCLVVIRNGQNLPPLQLRKETYGVQCIIEYNLAYPREPKPIGTLDDWLTQLTSR